MQALREGLDALWQRTQDNNGEVTVRKCAWYLLANVSLKREERVRDVLPLLIESPLWKEAGWWEDDPQRMHEVYSTWIAAWALHRAARLLAPTYSQESAEAKRVVNLALTYLEGVFEKKADLGAPFTLVEHPDRMEESQVNPAMTAYVLSLFGEVSLDCADDRLHRREKAYEYLASRENRFVWDSYREPYQRNSLEGDFEHFTSCWVARAFWLAMHGRGWNRAQRLAHTQHFARAIHGITEELIITSGDGLVRIDRGSPRDYSFAISDLLMLLRAIDDRRPDDESLAVFINRITAVGDIETTLDERKKLVEIAKARSELETAKSELEDRIDHLVAEAFESAANAAAAKAEALEMQVLLEKAKTEEAKIKDMTGRGSVAVAGYTWLDVLAALTWLGFDFWARSTSASNRWITYLGVVALVTLSTGIVYELVNAHRRNRGNWLLTLFAVAVLLVMALPLVAVIVDLRSIDDDTLQRMAAWAELAGGVASLIAAPVFNFKLHQRIWKES